MDDEPILFVTLSNIGDAVLTTPVLQSLHDLFPRSPIDIVADRRSAALFHCCPYRGRLLLKEKDRPLRGLPALLGVLRRVRYRLAVDLRTDVLAYLVRARRRLMRWRARPYGHHAVERHMGTIAALHGGRPLPATVLWLSREEETSALELLAPVAGGRILAMGPGANWQPKVWPAERFAQLTRHVQRQFDGIVILGDSRDVTVAATVAAASALPCINLCGRTALPEAAAVIRRAHAFLGNDSGLGHLASAVQTPSLTLFGPGEPGTYRPWGPRADFIQAPGGDLRALSAELVGDRLLQHLRRLRDAATVV